MQDTIRNVPKELDRAIKARAKQLGKSVNQLALEALSRALGVPVRRRNLREMPGAWSEREAKAFDRFLDDQRKIEAELWK
jgi:plasmid stability protein